MELRHLRYFVAVAEEMNFRRAAERLHIAIPPLSVQIRNLEREIGVDLFSRAGRSIQITDAGRAFLKHSRDTLTHANRSVAVARRAAGGEIGNLAIGYNTPAEFRIFPKIVPAFHKKYPDIHLNFRQLENSQIIEALRRDELDLGFLCLPIPTGEFESQELTKEPLVAVVPADHPFASRQSVSIKDLTTQPLILFPRILDPESYTQIEQLFMRAGASMNPVYELENSLSMMNFVAMGIGCSILPDYARRIRVEGIVYKPLRPRNIIKTLALIRKRKRRGALVDMFYDFTAQNLGELDPKPK
jgi:DNA-binding transcriptional LysR family regulator